LCLLGGLLWLKDATTAVNCTNVSYIKLTKDNFKTDGFRLVDTAGLDVQTDRQTDGQTHL